MMFSTKAEYGVRVMVELARRAGESPDGAESVVPLAEIAEHDGMPLAYLEHLVARLRKAGLLDSRRGSRGGYLLARPAEEITMAEVIEALEGAIAPIECISQGPDGSIVCSRESGRAGRAGRAGPHSNVCPTKLLWTRVRGSIVRTLEDTTLADLLVTQRPPSLEPALPTLPSTPPTTPQAATSVA
jgi:Rrf2 family cysteine metabolism transcriptional repressor